MIGSADTLDMDKAAVLKASAGLPLDMVLARLNAVDEGRDWRAEMDRDTQDPAVRQALNVDAWKEQDPQPDGRVDVLEAEVDTLQEMLKRVLDASKEYLYGIRHDLLTTGERIAAPQLSDTLLRATNVLYSSKRILAR